MQKGIIWDLDDTLIYTNALFEEAKADFVAYMQKLQLFDAEIYDVMNALDIGHVQKYKGYHKECFPYALRDTYQVYCRKYQKEMKKEEMERAENFGWQVFQKKSQLLPYAKEVLTALKQEYPLFLLTKGDWQVQNSSIDLHGLRPFFTAIYIFPDKSRAEYEKVIGENRLAVSASWSIGNSIKADINPSLQCGLQCIHINTTSWDYEYEMPLQPIFSVNSLLECKNIILEGEGEVL